MRLGPWAGSCPVALDGRVLRATVELAHDPLLVLRLRADGRSVDEVRGPPERQGLLRQVQGRHHMRQVLPEANPHP